jgi:hypothetical protein
MAKRRLALTCAYCGSPTNKPTRDHAIPRALWPDGKRPKNPVIVPACAKCHTEGDREVTYFRNMVVATLDPVKDPVVAALVDGPVTRAIIRDNRLYRDMIERAEFAWRPSAAGFFVEQGVKVPFDGQRFNAPLEKMVRALFFHKSKVPLPKTHKVVIYPGGDFWDKPGSAELIASMHPWQGFGDSVFQFRSVRDAADLSATAWVFVFYQYVGILASTIPIAAERPRPVEQPD